MHLHKPDFASLIIFVITSHTYLIVPELPALLLRGLVLTREVLISDL